MISVDNLTVHQGEFSLKNISFDVPQDKYAILSGASGEGKTTLLEVICGLRMSQGGNVVVADQNVTDLDPGQRNIGYVPQDAVLFPTMRVGRQVEFAMEVRGQSRKDRTWRVNELAGLLGIESILNRFPAGLSGGEKQRVALARALSFRPRVLCLDEPLSALDFSTKEKITQLLQVIHREEKVTVLHVTHNHEEASKLGTDFFELKNAEVKKINQ